MSKLLVRPSLHSAWPLPIRSEIHRMSLGLANLDHAAPGDLLGFALGHGLGPCYIGGSVTEYTCAFIGTSDGRCDGTVLSLRPHGQSILKELLPRNLEGGTLARIFHRALGAPEGEFETVHFADFTVAFLKDTSTSADNFRDIRIFAVPARDARDAGRRAAGIEALFAFLGDWHTTLSGYRYDLPTPEMLLRAA
ncbi:hypothetical protein RM543_17740 [Roseicyclus sp. F158]|uniref:Uncharacterized protein n=1 Tax=Tropicimonas omnivorans TaxID=3075590 RepID=A0ABU3DLE3_9RHOB|nr:hypothetical protein [Roseicyclus sp. F158]MDT0684521.1 hypothetical protein [Roseicyclus sp. F158]